MEYEQIQGIVLVYGTKKSIKKFLESEAWSGGILGDSKTISAIQLRSKSDMFKDVKHFIWKGD